MRALVIVNPVAGNGRAARTWGRIRRENAGLRECESVRSERIGHARELAHSAAQAGYDRVVVVGGDGTVSEVASGVAHMQTAVAVIPAGTGNDCCRNLGIPRDALVAANLALAGAVRRVDLGEIQTSHGTTYFVNVAGFGFDAEVAWRANALPKIVGGTLPYLVSVLQALRWYHAPPMRIRLDECELDQTGFLV